MIQARLRDQESQPLNRALESIDGVTLADTILRGMIRRGASRMDIVHRLRRIADALHAMANDFDGGPEAEEYFERRSRQIRARFQRFGSGQI
ncbi:hypothetical protein [Limibacillus halophilus]|jgi:hypothetical protein